MLKKWQKKSFSGTFIIFFFAAIIGLYVMPATTQPVTQLSAPGNFQVCDTVVNTAAEIEAYNDTVLSDRFIVTPTEDIIAVLSNLSLTGISPPYDFVITLTAFDLDLTLIDCNISGDLEVQGNSTITIYTTEINGSILEDVNPTLSATTTAYSVPFTFVFQGSTEVQLSWSGDDNIRGPDYALNYTLVISKNGVYQNTVTNLAVSTYALTVDTTAENYQVVVSAKDQQGNAATSSLTLIIVPTPNVFLFVLMIILIAGGAVGAVLIFYLRKQRQWQRTTLLEIPQ